MKMDCAYIFYIVSCCFIMLFILVCINSDASSEQTKGEYGVVCIMNRNFKFMKEGSNEKCVQDLISEGENKRGIHNMMINYHRKLLYTRIDIERRDMDYCILKDTWSHKLFNIVLTVLFGLCLAQYILYFHF